MVPYMEYTNIVLADSNHVTARTLLWLPIGYHGWQEHNISCDKKIFFLFNERKSHHKCLMKWKQVQPWTQDTTIKGHQKTHKWAWQETHTYTENNYKTKVYCQVSSVTPLLAVSGHKYPSRWTNWSYCSLAKNFLTWRSRYSEKQLWNEDNKIDRLWSNVLISI